MPWGPRPPHISSSSAPLTLFSIVVVSGTRAVPGVVIWQHARVQSCAYVRRMLSVLVCGLAACR